MNLPNDNDVNIIRRVTAMGGASGQGAFDTHTIMKFKVYTDPHGTSPETDVYECVSAVRPASLQTVEINGADGSVTTVSTDGWTYYAGDYPTGKGGHGSGSGIGYIEFIIQLNANFDLFINVHKSNTLKVTHLASGNSRNVPSSKFVRVDAGGIGPDTPISSDPAVQQFVNEVIAQVSNVK